MSNDEAMSQGDAPQSGENDKYDSHPVLRCQRRLIQIGWQIGDSAGDVATVAKLLGPTTPTDCPDRDEIRLFLLCEYDPTRSRPTGYDVLQDHVYCCQQCACVALEISKEEGLGNQHL